MREDSPFGNTSHNLAATNAQGLSQLNCKWTSGNPTTETGSLSVAVSQHSDKASSRRWSTGSSSRLNAKGRPHHDPLRKEVLIITLASDSLSTFFSLPSDSGAKRLSSWRVSSCIVHLMRASYLLLSTCPAKRLPCVHLKCLLTEHAVQKCNIWQ